MKQKNVLSEPQKIVLTTLRRNKDAYMKKTINHNGIEKYKMFDKEKNPIAWASKADVVFLSGINLLQWNEGGTVTLNHEAYNKFYKLNPSK